MKVAISSLGKELYSKVDRSFGRAKWFMVVDTETDTFEAHDNKQNINAAQGAGIQAGRNMADLGVDVVLTGNIGPKAFRTLSASFIKVFTIGKDVEIVQDALSKWKDGRLQEVKEATTEGHWV